MFLAKEFVTARDDEDRVLILSRCTGACRELRDALLMNPYDIEETAKMIRQALGPVPGTGPLGSTSRVQA